MLCFNRLGALISRCISNTRGDCPLTHQPFVRDMGWPIILWCFLTFQETFRSGRLQQKLSRFWQECGPGPWFSSRMPGLLSRMLECE